MAFQEIDTSTFAVGIKRGAASLTIRDNGQLSFSASMADVLAKSKLVYLRVDSEARLIQIQGVDTAPKGKEKSCLKVAWPKKGTGCTLSLAGVFKSKFGDYDYRGSGSQTINSNAVKSNVDKKVVQFVVPQGTLVAPPKRTRTKKGKVAAAAATVPLAEVATDVVDDDISI